MKLQNINQLPVDQPLKNPKDELQISPLDVYLPMPTLLITLAITTATLVLGGVIGKAQMSRAPSGQSKRSLKSSDQQPSQSNRAIMSKVQKVIKRLSCVALPCYAASSLGGARVALIMLVALFSKIVTLEDGELTMADMKRWKQLLEYRRWTLLSILAQVLFDFVSNANPSRRVAYATGYFALMVSVIALPPPFPSIIRGNLAHAANNKPASASVVLSSGFETPSIPEGSPLRKSTVSSLLSSPEELNITLEAGLISATLCVLLWFMSSPSADALDLTTLSWFILAACTMAACLLVAQPQSLQENRGLGILTGAFAGSVVTYFFHTDMWRTLAYQGVLTTLSFLATQIDTPTVLASMSNTGQRHSASHHNHTTSHVVHSQDHSRLTRFLLETFQHRALLHSILVEKDSRRIFYFMRSAIGIICCMKSSLQDPSLNFAFMLVQFFYGIATGSLGLLSDSIHMFFDCVALVVGLCAAVMSKWPPSPRFPYGYSKIDTLAGFANGIFLM